MRALRLLSFVLVLAIWMGVLGISVGKEIRVPQDYKTIQEAIDAAAEGDIILVDRGTYKENLNLPKGLTLLGVDREKTVIDGSGSDVVTIASSSLVTMRNFTITNGRDGVYIRGGAHALLQGNWIIQNKRNGVLVTGTAELRGNLIRDNGYCGVQASSSAKVTGSGNIIQNNQSGDLCGNVPSEIKAEGGPPAPTVRVNPSDWTNKNNFTLDWENPDYPAAIVAAWYKVGSAPTASEDGRRTTEKPVSLQSPAEGRTPVWLWLEDELKQKDHKNAGQAFLLWDPTPPTIIVTLDPRPNSNGWNNADVTVRFTCNDALSGVASCTPTEPVRFTQEGKGQTVKAEAIDRAGNRAEQTVTVNIDKTKPQITVGSPQGTLGNEGWFRSDVSVTFSATDNLAGFANGQLRYEETKRTSGEGPELRITFSVSDLAGNAAQEQAGPFKVDKTPPTISYEISPQPNSYGWNNTDVTVTFRCSDGLSGIVSCTPSDPVRFTQEGRGQTVKAEAIDQAGNRAERVVTINLDKTKPAVSCQPPDASRWYREDVSVPCTASDATSGLANPADASFTLVARGEGTSVSTGTRRVEDQAGNSATAGPYTFQIDKTPPTISYEISPQPNSYGWNNTDVTVSFRCDDRLSGVARCNDPIRVTQEGRRSIEGTGEDRAGNVGRVTVQVNIDKTPPTGSLTINDGAASTTSTIVTLRISANDALSGVSEMRFSNDGRTWSDWESFQSTRSWDLSRFGGSAIPGPKTVYAQLRDRAGNISQAFSATIRLAVGTLSGHTGSVRSVAFSPHGRLLASGSWDATIKLWDVASGQVVRTLSGHISGVSSVAFSPHGRLLASGGDRTIKLWDVASGQVVRTLSGHISGVSSVAFSPDGRLLASGSWDATIKLWDVATGREVRTLYGHTLIVFSVAFSPDGRLLASGSYEEIKLWEVGSGSLVRTLYGHTDEVTSVAFSPDGRLLASASSDRTIKLWEVGSGSLVRTLYGHTYAVFSVAFSPDGRLLASGSIDDTIKLWDVGSGQVVRTLSGHTNDVNSVAFSPDGRLLASGSDDKTIKLWDISDLAGSRTGPPSTPTSSPPRITSLYTSGGCLSGVCSVTYFISFEDPDGDISYLIHSWTGPSSGEKETYVGDWLSGRTSGTLTVGWIDCQPANASWKDTFAFKDRDGNWSNSYSVTTSGYANCKSFNIIEVK